MKAAKKHHETKAEEHAEEAKKVREHKAHAKGGEVAQVNQGTQDEGDKPSKGKTPAKGGEVGAMKNRGHQEIHVGERPRVRRMGGKVEGKAPKHRLDKKARGGRMTPASPLSGADVKPMPYYADRKAPDVGSGKGKDKAGAYGRGSGSH